MKNIFRTQFNIRNTKKIIAVVISLVILASVIGIYERTSKNSDVEEPQICESCRTDEPILNGSDLASESINQNQAIKKPEETLPESFLIKMDFASQAPEGNWDEPWQNACEEASIITVHHYLSKTVLNKAIMKNEILAMVNWQIANWGGHRDLTSEKTIELADQFYDHQNKVVYDYNIEKIKYYISKGIPVVIPADGKKLGNPNFRNGGPEYHMLVIKGYDSDEFITNDPGTRNGEGYKYKYQTILNSIKNPDGGAKSIFVLTD
jgi:uncharacterized protein YvpB